jgi:hypothetical protein
MKDHADEQNDPYDPKQLTIAEFRSSDLSQEHRISIDIVRATGNHNENDTGRRHHYFLADHGVP